LPIEWVKEKGGTVRRNLLIFILAFSLIIIGCSKDQDEIDALQEDATEMDASAAMDSLESTGDEGGEAVTDYAEPEVTAAEESYEPEPEPEYPDVEGFVVQLGSYYDYELAEYFAGKYKNRDYPAFVRQIEIDGETYYRLRVGVYETYEEAERVGEELVDKYSATYWIDNNR
jgi:cell division septation protein DedD